MEKCRGFDVNRKTKNLLTKMLVLSAVLAFAVGACDFKPSTAFDGFDGETRSGIIDEEGATLRGTFQGGQSNVRAARAQRAFTAASAADDLTVYVFDPAGFDFALVPGKVVKIDEAIGSAPIVGGSFTLRGLPGSFVIVFVDADDKMVGDFMEFDGVKPNQEIDIVVELLPSGDVILVEESRTGIDHDELEFNGPAYHVQIDAFNSMNGSLDVNDYYVVSRAGQTSIRKGNRSLTLEDIEEGVQVKVRGILETVDGVEQVFAYEIKLQDDVDDGDTTEDTIVICHIPPGNPDNAKTKTIPTSAWPAHKAHGDTLGPCP